MFSFRQFAVIVLLISPLHVLYGIEPPPTLNSTPSEKAKEDNDQNNACSSCSANANRFDFSKLPATSPLPPLGFYPVQPSGPGYYSALDFLEGRFREKPPQYGYNRFALFPASLFDADFRYLDSEKYTDRDFFDNLHRIPVKQNWLFSTGGQAWWRYMNDTNAALTSRNSDYHLGRVRAYADILYKDCFRAYVEFIHANSYGAELPEALVDVNQADLLNAFIDLKVADVSKNPTYLRFGRQELLFGSQRLVSPLEWVNTRRTFQGIRLIHHTEKFDVDAFWTQPVVPSATRFDSVANNINFAGLWTTYRPKKGHLWDTYYLFADDTNRRSRLGISLSPFNVHTLGCRYAGKQDDRFLWEIEGMFQFGESGQQDILAGSGTIGAGYHCANIPWNPTFWLYYDYATGDNNPGVGSSDNTFRQLFPFGHYYMGWADIVGRQNIRDLNCHLYVFPTPWITCWTQFHHFHLANAKDALYNPAGIPLRRDPSGNAGTYVGNELDFIVNFHLTRHADIMFGYSHLYGASFLAETGKFDSAEQLFVQYNYRW